MRNVIKITPVVKSYIWGGNYFQKYGKGNIEVISELWELTIRDNDCSLVFDSQKRLDEIITKEDLGPNCERFPYFPLLIKLIDAKENLSVQVHPNDEYALTNEGSYGKSEVWHILSADEGAGIYVGLNKNYSKEEIEAKLKDNTILDALNYYKVSPGETYIINPGTLHVIGKGVRIIEIQQNSDLTYRLYDYQRKDKNGHYRELHIDKALKVIDYNKYIHQEIKGNILADNKYFKVKKIHIDGEYKLHACNGSFMSFTFIEGEGKVDNYDYQKFDTFFLPHNGQCVIKGKGTIIVSEV